MATIEEISSLLDSKFAENLKPIIESIKPIIESIKPIIERLDSIEARLTVVETKLDKALAFVPVGNEDVVKKLKRAH